MEPHKIVPLIVCIIGIFWFACYMAEQDTKYRKLQPSLWDEIQDIKASLKEIQECLLSLKK